MEKWHKKKDLWPLLTFIIFLERPGEGTGRTKCGLPAYIYVEVRLITFILFWTKITTGNTLFYNNFMCTVKLLHNKWLILFQVMKHHRAAFILSPFFLYFLLSTEYHVFFHFSLHRQQWIQGLLIIRTSISQSVAPVENTDELKTASKSLELRQGALNSKLGAAEVRQSRTVRQKAGSCWLCDVNSSKFLMKFIFLN